jgi:hypothetical protein
MTTARGSLTFRLTGPPFSKMPNNAHALDAGFRFSFICASQARASDVRRYV